MDIVERLRDMARCCRNFFSNSELLNCFKQGLPDATRSLLENNPRLLSASTLHDLNHAKQYALTTKNSARTCKAPYNLKLSTPRQHTQEIHHIHENHSMDSFQTSLPTFLSASVPSKPHVFELTKVRRLQVSNDRTEGILVQMENVLNISNTGKGLSESLSTHICNIGEKKQPILQLIVKVPKLTTAKCHEAMNVVPKDI